MATTRSATAVVTDLRYLAHRLERSPRLTAIEGVEAAGLCNEAAALLLALDTNGQPAITDTDRAMTAAQASGYGRPIVPADGTDG